MAGKKMIVVFLWILLLVVFYISGNGTGFWFQLILWGGVALLILKLLLLVHKNGGKQENVSYIYLSVFFQTRGNWYYYLTEDSSIRPNDVVVVPWGKNNNPELAIVGWVEHRTAENVPYPLSRMKHIIRKASDNCRCAFDEMVKWPMEVNISQRWTRDEKGNGIQAVNSREEREKLRAWIGENPRLIPVERMVIGEETEEEKFREAVRWYHIANDDW